MSTPASTRATRSRYSSPQVSSSSSQQKDHDGSADKGGTSQVSAQQAYMSRWLEPPLQNKSSFEEAGFQRHGVFGGMAPLGTMPKLSNAAKRVNNIQEEKQYHESHRLHHKQMQRQRQRQKQRSQQGQLSGDFEDDQKELSAELEEQEPHDHDLQQEKELGMDAATPQDMEVDEAEGQSPPRQHDHQDDHVNQDNQEHDRAQNATPALQKGKTVLEPPSSSRHVPTHTIGGDDVGYESEVHLKNASDKGTDEKPGGNATRDTSASSLSKSQSAPPRPPRRPLPGSRKSPSAALAGPSKRLAGPPRTLPTTATVAVAVEPAGAERVKEEEDASIVDQSRAIQLGTPNLASEDLSLLGLTGTQEEPSWRSGQRPRSDSNATEINRETTDIVMENAVAEALRHHRYPTAYALRTLYDERSSDQGFLAMLEDVFQQTADKETVDEFARLLYQKKLEGKKDDRGFQHCFQNEGLDESPRSDASTPPKPQRPLPAPYAHLVKLDLSRFIFLEDKDGTPSGSPACKKVKLTMGGKSAPVSVAGPSSISAGSGRSPEKSSASASASATARSKTPPNSDTLSQPPKTPTRIVTIKTPAKNTAAAAPSTSPSKIIMLTARGKALASQKASTASSVAAPVTPSPSGRGHNRTTSAASSTSSLSTAQSMPTPAPLRIVKTASAHKKRPGQQEDQDQKAESAPTGEATDEQAKQAVQPTLAAEQTAGQTSELTAPKTVESKASEALSTEARPKLPLQRLSAQKKMPLQRLAKPNEPHKRKGGGRGGPRPGAGRRPKNKTLALAAAAKAAAAVAAAAAANAAGNTDAGTAAIAGASASAPAPAAIDQPITTRNRAASKKTTTVDVSSTPTTPAVISSSSSHNTATTSKATNTTTKAATTTPHTVGSSPSTATKRHSKRVSAAAAAAAISASAAASTGATSDAMPAVVDETPVTKRTTQNSRSKVATPAVTDDGVRNNSNIGTAGELPPPPPPAKAGSAAAKYETTEEQDLYRTQMRHHARRTTNSIPQPFLSYERTTPPGVKPDADADADEDAGATVDESTNADVDKTVGKIADAHVDANADENDSNSRSRSRNRLFGVATAAASRPSRRGSSSLGTDLAEPETPRTPSQQRSLRASTATAASRATRATRKRGFDEMDQDDRDSVVPSPSSSSIVRPSEEPAASSSTRLQTPVPSLLRNGTASDASVLDSRAGTPGPKTKKARTGPRVKTSPAKRKTGSAGASRSTGDRGSPTPANPYENDDYCSSCGGIGDLICCDGCTRSFHFYCVDTPLGAYETLPDEWLCNACLSQHNPAAVKAWHKGLFGELKNRTLKSNSAAFHLPASIRNYFDGMKTSPEGVYEEVVVAGTNANRSRRRAGYDETQDFFRMRDNEGKVVLCHQCNETTAPSRPIIPCAFCDLWWHTDCLDPPMAQPPPLRNWRCPAHVHDLLNKTVGVYGPSHRFRTVRGNNKAIKQGLSRGLRNNGFIEIVSDDEQDQVDEENDPNNHSGWPVPSNYGLPSIVGARGVQLDFVEFVHQQKLQKLQKLQRQRTGMSRRARMYSRLEQADEHLTPAQGQVVDRTLAAHNLASVSSRPVAMLIRALLTEADESTVALIAHGNSINMEIGKSLTPEDRNSLVAMRARIDDLLNTNTTGAVGVNISAASVPKGVTEKTEMEVEAQRRHSAADLLDFFFDGAKETAGVTPFDQGPVDTPTASSAVEPAEQEDVEMSDAAVASGPLEEDSGSSGPKEDKEEVISLVSDNGEGEDDEDPPALATPPAVSMHDETASAVWPAEHPRSDGSDLSNGGSTVPPPVTKAVLADDSNFLCPGTDGNDKTHDASVAVNDDTNDNMMESLRHELKSELKSEDVQEPKDSERISPKTDAPKAPALLSTPLTPPRAQSETVAEDKTADVEATLTEEQPNANQESLHNAAVSAETSIKESLVAMSAKAQSTTPRSLIAEPTPADVLEQAAATMVESAANTGGSVHVQTN